MDNSPNLETPMFVKTESPEPTDPLLCGKKREGSPLDDAKPKTSVRKEQMKKNSKNYRHRMKEYIKEMEAKIEQLEGQVTRLTLRCHQYKQMQGFNSIGGKTEGHSLQATEKYFLEEIPDMAINQPKVVDKDMLKSVYKTCGPNSDD